MPFNSLDVRTPSGGLSPSPVAAPVKKKIFRRLITDGDVEAKRLQVRGDREKAASLRAERNKLLARVSQLDHNVDLYDGSVLEGAAAVVQLLERQRWEKEKARKAKIARARAISSTTSSSMGHAG